MQSVFMASEDPSPMASAIYRRWCVLAVMLSTCGIISDPHRCPPGHRRAVPLPLPDEETGVHVKAPPEPGSKAQYLIPELFPLQWNS